MDTLKKWTALAVVAALVILAGGWFLLVSPKRTDAAALRTQAAEKQRANLALQTQLAQLKAQAKDLPKQQAKLAAVAAKIPNNSAMPALVRALNKAASDANVELVSVSPAAPTPVVAAAAATTATAANGTGAAAGGTGAAGLLQQIPVTLNVVGSYFQVAQYLDRLEGLTRAFRVTGFVLAPGANPVKPSISQASTDSGKVLSANITGQVYQTTGSSAAAPAVGK
ncbi:MAG: type 4a pilus biogenesis protein PilO [Mycobacteriales bacterium]